MKEKFGRPIARPAFARPPCHRCPKMLWAGDGPGWERAADWTPRLQQAVEHAELCLATGRTPDDEIVGQVVLGLVFGRREAELTRQDRANDRLASVALMRR